MKRLFVFGCSFTNFIWPTWADFLSLSYDEYYNYGRQGAGNQYIFESLIEANITHKFTSDDTVIVMWSTYHRHDIYKNNDWITPGNILNAEFMFDDAYIDKYFDIKGSVLHSLNYIYAAQEVLNNQKCEWHMASMQSLAMPIGETYDSTVLSWFKNNTLFEEFPEFKKYEFVFGCDNWYSPSIMEFMSKQSYSPNDYMVVHYIGVDPALDNHPTPAMHLEWCYKVGLDIDTHQSENLLLLWNKEWNGKPVHSKNGRIWCKENIASKQR